MRTTMMGIVVLGLAGCSGQSSMETAEAGSTASEDPGSGASTSDEGAASSVGPTSSDTGEGAAESESSSGAEQPPPPVGCGESPSVVGLDASDGSARITAFPVALTFDDSSYVESGVVWTTTDIGAQHEHVPDGGWDGCGAARFHAPTQGEGMSGIGQFVGLRDILDTPTLAIRYCIAAGPTFPALSSGAKPVILWRADPQSDSQVHDEVVGSRPMVISRPDPRSDGVAYGLCDGTVCTYVGGDYWPDGSDTWLLRGDAAWSCIEFDFDLESDQMEMFVTTRDGQFDDTLYLTASFRDENSGPGGVFSTIDIMGGYFAMSSSDPDNYYLLDDLVVDLNHIGPPPGFGAG